MEESYESSRSHGNLDGMWTNSPRKYVASKRIKRMRKLSAPNMPLKAFSASKDAGDVGKDWMKNKGKATSR